MAESKIDQPARNSKRSHHIAWVTLLTALLAVVILVWTGRTNHSQRQTKAALPSPNTPSGPRSPDVEDPDVSLKKMMLGTWEREYHGSWIMNIEDDGRGTLVIRPSGLWGTLIGEKVLVNLDWSLNDGRAELVSVSGEPETAFTAAKLLFGDRRIRKIKELTETRLVFIDEEDNSETEWTRTDSSSQ